MRTWTEKLDQPAAARPVVRAPWLVVGYGLALLASGGVWAVVIVSAQRLLQS